jgi:hypothetical protein
MELSNDISQVLLSADPIFWHFRSESYKNGPVSFINICSSLPLSGFSAWITEDLLNIFL